jgi:hypothetical protein
MTRMGNWNGRSKKFIKTFGIKLSREDVVR